MEDIHKNTEGQEDPTLNQDDEGVDYKSLYLSEVQNAKKLRKRSQTAEEQLKEFNKAQEEQKLVKLKEQEEFQALSEELKGQLEEALPYKEKWNTYEANRRDALLNDVPDEDKERLSSVDLDTLEYFVAKLKESKTNNPTPTVGSVRDFKDIPDNPFKLPPEERKKVWADVLQRHKQKL